MVGVGVAVTVAEVRVETWVAAGVSMDVGDGKTSLGGDVLEGCGVTVEVCLFLGISDAVGVGLEMAGAGASPIRDRLASSKWRVYSLPCPSSASLKKRRRN
jgi:hypothetical protein